MGKNFDQSAKGRNISKKEEKYNTFREILSVSDMHAVDTKDFIAMVFYVIGPFMASESTHDLTVIIG